MASDYSLSDAFKAIEDDLIASMMRNIDHHRAEEDDQGINWTMWQSEQLKSLEEYKQSLEGYKEKFADINSQIDKLIRTANKTGSMEQEIEILEAIKQGFSATKVSSGLSAKFFSLNERKLEALITATVSDMEKAEYAILRKSEDAYRKVIYNAQVYANTGAGTYEKAVDMATKDMLSAGLTCVQYKNGAVHTLADYADMAIRTASKRAYLQGEGAMRQEWGIHTVIVNKRINPCPHCLPFCGKVFIDDVWSGGTKKDGDYPLLSTAIAAGLYHPRCKDAHSTYFPGISSEPDKTYSKKELKTIEKNEARETRQQYAQRQADKYGRLSKYSLDDENRQKYAAASERYEEAASSLDTGTSTTQGTLEELFDGALDTMERQLEDVSEELEEIKSISIDEDELDLMASNFRPRYGTNEKFAFDKETTIEVKKVSNSKYDMYTDAQNTRRNKSVRLTERLLDEVQEYLPDGYEMPRVMVIDVDEIPRTITLADGTIIEDDRDIIGGYSKQHNILFLDSKRATREAILEYVNRTPGMYANPTEYAPALHELGHKYYYDCIEELAKKQKIEYDTAKKIIDDRIAKYIRGIKESGVSVSRALSVYAQDGYVEQRYTEVIAESFTVKETNSFAMDLINLIRSE